MKDFEMTIDEYLPLRDVVFNTLRSIYRWLREWQAEVRIVLLFYTA